MPYTSAVHDEAVHKAFHLKKFVESYGENADIKALYKAQPVWIRFAALFPRTAYLLDVLQWIYAAIEVALMDFRACLAYDRDEDWQKVGAPYDASLDPFDFFMDSKNEDAERSCLLHLRWALKRNRGHRLGSLFEECAHDLIAAAKSDERAQIRAELLSKEGDVAEALNSAPADLESGIWSVRRRILIREEVLDDALSRMRDVLDSDEPLRSPSGSSVNGQPSRRGEDFEYEYGEDPIPVPGTEAPRRRNARFSRSPPRVVSVDSSPDRRRSYDSRYRSISQESGRSSVAPGSSITTYLPVIPEDSFSLSVNVYSTSLGKWTDSMAVLDTGCDAGNFISSSFLEDGLQMGAVIEEDAESASITLMDFGGRTDFKPRGRVKLSWYGRNIDQGSKGKRSMNFESYFHVAPRLPEGHNGEPFQILLGKDWIVSTSATSRSF